MNLGELITQQREERAQHLEKILRSTAKKKLIVAGAGTGKTATFGKILAQRESGNNLAMTFIRKLAADMEVELGGIAEVKTFHRYCKKILHSQNGKVELVPYLTKIVEKDAELLGKQLDGFDTKLRTLEEASPEVTFYLQRGDYYEVVGFDDSVYRLYKEIRSNLEILPSFDQIVVDEFQDFNPLEVAFIEEIAKKGDILIVGDDDQAVYDDRSASPTYLRQLHAAPDFEKFELPFCSRCPQAVVTATNRIIETAQQHGIFKGRIPKRYECYLEHKQADSIKYPKIILASCTTAKVIPKYIHREIAGIGPADIAESRTEGREYPTVLIVGTRQYLREVEKSLRPLYPQILYAASLEPSYGIVEAYECLLRDERSSLGWRILVELFCDGATQKWILAESEAGKPIVDLLDSGFVVKHLKAIGLVRSIRDQNQLASAVGAELKKLLDTYADAVLTWLTQENAEEQPPLDKTKPTILLTSYKGCKGLSAGHVFVVGVHNGSIPRNKNNIKDVEVSQFIVALTRTRKQCHIVSVEWLIGPKDNMGNYVPPFEASPFVQWIPSGLIEDRGKLKAKDMK